MTAPNKLTVEQCDRDAGYSYWLYTHSLHQTDYRAVRAKIEFETGRRDEKESVQAFARHRQQAEARAEGLVEALEKIASCEKRWDGDVVDIAANALTSYRSRT